MSVFCGYRNCYQQANPRNLGFCNDEHMLNGINEHRDWFAKAQEVGLFEIFRLRDTRKKPWKQLAPFQVRRL